MRKYILLPLWAIICCGFVYLSNCSKPLDANAIGQTSSDTIYVIDTVSFSDTLYADSLIIDTLYMDTLIIDTLYIDTLFVDTMFIDSSRIDTMFCSTLSSYHRRIVWLLFNPDGYYELEFRAAIDGMTSCIPTLLIEVDDQHYTWRLSDGLHYAIDQHLDPYATVKITSDPPHVYGKEVDICMNVKRP